ncbi:MAG TPA: phenylalanine--tRNA ligase subunit beta [Stellaceae bacterium]|nr:phenylalanine--tRNA ligase subunit beta [Stellaceae bacterium]
MKTTLAWLKTHLETEKPIGEIAALLAMRGFEVEGIENPAQHLAPFRVARVKKAEPHPNADKLKLCVVDAGAGEVQVVCGAPNAHEGMLGVFAPPGVVIPRSGQALKASTIRGVASNGMLCSGWELGLSEDREGIIELPEGLKVGSSFAEAMGLDDPVIDIKVTANRGDCLGVHGIARDLAAAGLGALKPLDAAPVPGRFPCSIAVHLAGPDEKACPLFLGRLVRNVKNGPSPAWLVRRLEAVGLRPISALVDITNFITYDLGRPLHAFDAAKLDGDLAVRVARAGESLAALNGKSYELDPAMTVIADNSGPLSLGGVIGGESTGCTEGTTSVFLEAALFDPVRTAATGRALNLQTDARYRFERGVDPEFVRPGLEIATRLILELCGGEASEIRQSGAVPPWRRELTFRPDRVKTLGGLDMTPGRAIETLTSLGCTITPGAPWTVVPPSWRPDIEGEADLVEEALRIAGYENIPPVPLARETPLPKPALDAGARRDEFVRRTLAARGLVEAATFSFLSSGEAGLFGGGVDALRLANPISAELDEMRPSLLPNLLAAARRNADRGFPDCALFEVGAQYRDATPEGQAEVAAGVRAGATGAKRWDDPGHPADAYLAKADAVAALAACGIAADSLQAGAEPPPWYHPGRGGTLRLGPKVLAAFGEIHPAIVKHYDLKGAAAGFEVFLDDVPLPRARGRARPLLKLSPFQPVERDFAFVVPADLPAETLLRTARGIDKKLVADVRLFDVYTGAGMDPGTKSLAITVVLQPEDATLTDALLEGFSKRLVAAVEKATGGKLRG